MSNTAESAHFSYAGGDANDVSLLRILGMTVLAVILNLLVLSIGSAAGASLKTTAPEPISATTMAIMTAVPLLLAGAVVWFLARRFPVRRLFAWVGLVFALVTSAGSFMASADIATAFTLAPMHFITGFAWFIALRPWVKTARP